MSDSLLEKINTPQDLKALSDEDIPALCEEIRSFLIEKVEASGGHLASNLGVIEMTLAIHRVFDAERDHIVFDVGHQAYVHKIITGRRERFDDLRKPGGLSGFTSIKESKYDCFGAGHSSTSVSAALGFAEADKLKGSDAHTVCVIGDGAYTGGMVHEALNNCKPELPLVIILNENGMSISNNKGTFASYLSGVRISRGYLRWKSGTNSILKKIPVVGRALHKCLFFIKEAIKRIAYSSNYFEDLGLYYIGPIDGNNYKKAEKALKAAKRLKKCVVVHMKTQKGKGYEPAERSPDEYHSVSSAKANTTTFHSTLADELTEMAGADNKITAVTAAMGMGTGLAAFGKIYPERYFDVGIAEEHALTFSAGLAASGIKPYVAIYSTFLQRGYDNIIHDIALQSLPVRLLIDRAGISSADGATHHGIFDVSFLSHIPNISIYAPATYGSLRAILRSTENAQQPVAIRYPNLAADERVDSIFYPDGDYSTFGVKSSFPKDKTPEYVYITYGRTVSFALDAVMMLSDMGIDAGVVLVERIKPYEISVREIFECIKNAKRIIYVEEGIKNGGAAMITKEMLQEEGFDLGKSGFDIVAIDDNFVIPEKICDIYDFAGFTAERLAKWFLEDGN